MSQIPSVNYQARDFTSITASFKAFLQQTFPNDWKNFYLSGISEAWADLVGVAFDNLSYNIDIVGLNSTLFTCLDMEAAVRWCKSVGYPIRPATSASVVCTATLAAVQSSAVLIPKGLAVQTAGSVNFTVLFDQYIPAGSLTAEITLTEGSAQTDTFDASGETFQKITLSKAQAADNSLVVTVNSVVWTEVPSLVFAASNGTNYSVSYDANNFAIIQFGDGTTGSVPAAGTANISVAYRVAGGVVGNIPIGAISTTLSETTVPTNLTNDQQTGSGGEPPETLAHIKMWAPLWVSANGRAVTENDFDVLATQFYDQTYGSPAFAKSQLHQEIPESNAVDLYVWARDGSGDVVEPSGGLMSAMQTYFDNNGPGAVRLICVDVNVLPGQIVYLDIDATVTVVSQFAAASVMSAVRAAIDTLFSSSSNLPGAAFRLSVLYDAIQNIPGVDHALVNSLIASTQQTVQAAIGTGGTTYTFTLPVTLDLPIRPNTVEITDGTQVVTDDGEGNLVGAVGAGTNLIDYHTGITTVTFAAVVGGATIIDVTFREVLSSQWVDPVLIVDATMAAGGWIEGTLNYPPAMPLDSYLYGVAITDGQQVLTDDGNGNLCSNTGTAYETVHGTINYSTGGFRFHFHVTPLTGTQLTAAYTQMFDTSSKDIILDKLQLAVEGQVRLTTA